MRFFWHATVAARASQTPNQGKMILTNCAACAAPLAHDAPRCVRCKVRYCNRTCQRELIEAEKLLADVYARQRRVCGASHPDTLFTQGTLGDARAALEVARRRVETSK